MRAKIPRPMAKLYNYAETVARWLFRGRNATGENRSPLFKELSAIIYVAGSLVLLLSMISFDSVDNGLSVGEGEYKNWLGPIGAWVSDVLFSLLGIWAFLVPAAGFYVALTFSLSRSQFTPIRLLGFGLMTLGAMPLVQSRVGDSLSFLVSGLLGEVLRAILERYASQGGMWIFALTLFFSGLLLVVGRPFITDSVMALLRQMGKLNQLAYKKPASGAIKIVQPIIEEAPRVAKNESLIEKPVLKNLSEIPIVARRDVEGAASVKKIDAQVGFKTASYELPPLKLLDYDAKALTPIDPSQLKREAEKLKAAFLQFGIEGAIREIRPGPVVTNYEFVPAPGIKLSKIAALSDDIAMAMAAVQVRIVTPIPGKGAVGIEVPNEHREMVYLKEVVASPEFRDAPHKLTMAIGKTVEGRPFFMNLAEMPHVLIAGTTGSGKSVSVNAMICSILFRATPKDVRFLMIDPKMLELSIYRGIPHLLLPPIIDPKRAANALKWAVHEMELRYALMKEAAVRDIDAYNKVIATKGASHLKPIEQKAHEHLPFIVVVVDEYADLVMVAGKEVENLVMRLAQKARAAGMHVMLATQRPSVDVVTGVIKANFPVRMGFRLASSHDSKTIINKTGAEKLLGRGDVLIMPPGTSDLTRIHGAFISEKELSRVVAHLNTMHPPEYQEEIADFAQGAGEGNTEIEAEAADEKFAEAVAIVREYRRCSTSFMQRQLSIGYNRAARIVEHMEKAGMVGPVLNAKGEREIFVDK